MNNATTNNAIASGAVSILRYRDLSAAVRFLHRAFGIECTFAAEADGVIVHAQLRAGASRLFVSPDNPDDAYGMRSPSVLPGTNQCVYLVVESDAEVDDHAVRAEAAGAVIVAAPHDTDYGGREYSCRDLEGHVWSVGSYAGEPFDGDSNRDDVVTFQTRISAPVSDVWSALTASDVPRPWMWDTTISNTAEVGDRYAMSSGGADLITGTVLAVVPRQLLRMTFNAQWDTDVASEPAGQLTYRLNDLARSGTLMTVELSGMSGATATAVRRDTPVIYLALKDFLETRHA
jgi:uncharacterized glyoxalase superfamily protein PhnB/uncharacterized protein YndB with AHSA1/START domain